MFHRIRQLNSDWNVLKPGASHDPNVVTMGPGKPRTDALHRVFAQFALTLFVIVLCVFVVVSKNVSETSIRLAHTGFGIVMGYWFS